MVRDETAQGFRRSRLLLWAILLCVLAGAVWAGLALYGGATTGTAEPGKGRVGMGSEASTRAAAAMRPTLDEATPQAIETATFALG